MVDTTLEFIDEPEPIFSKIAGGLQMKAKISKAKIEMREAVWQDTRDSAQQSCIQIIMKELGLIHINFHARCITEGFKDDLKCYPILKSTHPEQDHIIYKE